MLALLNCLPGVEEPTALQKGVARIYDAFELYDSMALRASTSAADYEYLRTACSFETVAKRFVRSVLP